MDDPVRWLYSAALRHGRAVARGRIAKTREEEQKKEHFGDGKRRDGTIDG